MIMANQKTQRWARCMRCGEEVEMMIHKEDVERWKSGTLIQDAMPYLSADEREILISGTCGPCFDNMYRKLD